MKNSRSLLFSVLFLAYITFTAAWPWPRWLPERDSLVVRQDSKQSASNSPDPTNSGSSSKTNTGKDTTITNPPSTSSGKDSSSSKTGSGTDSKETGTNTGKTSGKTSTTKAASKTKTVYDARLPAGGVAMVTPAVIDGMQYYKIGDFVTFKWNYTSLEATPTAVNIVASCKANDQLYTLAMNQTVANSTQGVVWDTNAYQQTAVSDPLLTEKYTLIIYDSDSSISAQASAGYLAAFNQYTFGMYTPQPYTPLNQFICATCSGALSEMERRAIGMVFGVGVITVLSFTWFVGGTGVIW